jgi:hypothetical protein
VGILRADCVALALVVLAMPVPAQNADLTDRVSVNISAHQMLAGLARPLPVDAAQIPMIVQVSIQVAGRVCDVLVKWLRTNAHFGAGEL